MIFAQKTIGSLQSAKRSVTIDWSGQLTEQATSEENISNMINWLKKYPNTKDIQVFVSECKQKHSGIRLKRALQSLGCTVTVKQQFSFNG